MTIAESKLFLGRLEKVDLRTCWNREDTDFTPWLGREENIRLLGDAIGLDLVVEANEERVGPFRADLLCKETTTDTWVLVENQLERTDHSHLGQLLTYAAGLKAVTIVWVAQRFTDEHRATLDWLNSITDERFNFFGLEIELWRIGDSAPAPKFNTVAKPNNWQRSVTRTVKRMDDDEDEMHHDLAYWTEFKELVLTKSSPLKFQSALPKNYLAATLGRSGFILSAVNVQGEIRAEVVLHGPRAHEQFHLLQSEQEAIEADMREAIEWDFKADRKKCKIIIRREADVNDEDDWPNQHEWLKEKLESLFRAFGPRIQRLPK